MRSIFSRDSVAARVCRSGCHSKAGKKSLAISREFFATQPCRRHLDIGFSQSPERPYLHYVVMPSPPGSPITACNPPLCSRPMTLGCQDGSPATRRLTVRLFWGRSSDGCLNSRAAASRRPDAAHEQLVYVAIEIATQRSGTDRDRNGQGTIWHSSYPH